MKVEGVHFVDEAVCKMKKKEFIEKHKCLSFLRGRTKSEKERILSDIYDRIIGSGKVV